MTTPITYDNLWKAGYIQKEDTDGDDFFKRIESIGYDPNNGDLKIRIDFREELYHSSEPLISVCSEWDSCGDFEDENGRFNTVRTHLAIPMWGVKTMEDLATLEGFLRHSKS